MGDLCATEVDSNIQPELVCGPATARVCVIVLMSVAPIITKGHEDAKGLGLHMCHVDVQGPCHHTGHPAKCPVLPPGTMENLGLSCS